MSRFRDHETPDLIDMLARHTEQLIGMFTENEFGKEYDDCKEIIEELLTEIEVRKGSKGKYEN